MSVPLIVEGNSYQYPSQGDKANTGWGNQTTNWASAVTSALTKLGLGGTLSPIANAVINIDSTSKGILIPRMTTAQRNAISSPSNSLLIFNTDLKVLQYYDLSVTSWISVGAKLPDNVVFSGTLTVNGNITGLGSITATSGLNGATGNFTDTTDATDADNAPLKTLGGMAVKKKLFVGTDLSVGGSFLGTTGNFTNTTDATNSTTAPLKTAGGMAIAKKLFVGTDLEVNGNFNHIPFGSIIFSIRSVTPSGFLLCDGAEYSRTSYSNLFSVMPSLTNTITLTIASPCVVTWTNHGLATGQSIQFSTTGALPTGIVAGTIYYIRKINNNTFHLYNSLSNSMNINVTTGIINTSGTQSGTHTALSYLYGNGDGITTFNIPDLRGASPRGAGTSAGYIESVTLSLGEKTDDQFQGHWHSSGYYAQANAMQTGASSFRLAGSGSEIYGLDPINGNHGNSRFGRETRSKTQAFNFYIKF